MALLELAVTDLALIERARLRLRPGFTVITGETGAGKSLLIDALALVLGGRADPGMVRSGSEAARVEALFDRPPSSDGAAGEAVGSGPASDGGSDEPLICVREVAQGRSVARVDDEAVTLARLAAIVGPLVEIHGQHDQGRLLSPSWQRSLLDASGGHAALLDAVAEAVAAWRQNQAALAELDIEPAELVRRSELAEHAAAEIAAAAPRPGEMAELQARLAAAAGAERLVRLSGAIRERLVGEGRSVRDLVAAAASDLRELSRTDARLGPIEGRLAGLEAEAVDIADELRRAADGSEAAAAASPELEERLGTLYGLLRKYGDTEEAIVEHGERAREEAERLRDVERVRATRSEAAVRLHARAVEEAAALTQARDVTAGRLAPAVTDVLRGLGFANAAFAVEVTPAALGPAGADEVTFLLAPNPGEPARPLARIASGGELSRVALAIKQVLAAADDTPTLVFDEVDAGIGGRSAEPVGRSLWLLARDHQVLCVTHLPQIAAHADTHLRIAKRVADGRTVTEVHELGADERVHEVAAMLGGSSEAARSAARELIAHALATHRSLAAA